MHEGGHPWRVGLVNEAEVVAILDEDLFENGVHGRYVVDGPKMRESHPAPCLTDTSTGEQIFWLEVVLSRLETQCRHKQGNNVQNLWSTERAGQVHDQRSVLMGMAEGCGIPQGKKREW